MVAVNKAEPPRMLEGVRVLDLGRLMPSAIATFELAKLGADVIKIEMPPHGDYFRDTPPLIRGRGDMHLNINRSKRSLCLDLRSQRGRAVLLRMASQANIFLEVSRPGTMEAMGLGYEQVRAVRPSIVYCSISGYGQDGPYHSLPAHGLSADAAAGLLDDIDQDGNHHIAKNHVSVGPRACGLYAAVGLLGALYRQQFNGEGQYLDVSQGDAALAWNYRNLDSAANDVPLMPAYDMLGPRHAFYRTSDGKFILFAATERKFWELFCDKIGRPELKTQGSSEIVSYVEDDLMRRSLREIIGTRTRDEWLSFGAITGVPIAPVVQRSELPDDPQVKARRMLQIGAHPLGGEVALTGHPVKFAGLEVSYCAAPEMGGNNQEVLRDYGFSDAEVQQLIAQQVVVEPSRPPQPGSTKGAPS